MIMYHAFVSLDSMLFDVVPLCIGCISAWLSLPHSRHSHTVPLAFVTITKVLHHLAVSSTIISVSNCCSFSLSNSLLDGSCSGYDMCYPVNLYA